MQKQKKKYNINENWLNNQKKNSDNIMTIKLMKIIQQIYELINLIKRLSTMYNVCAFCFIRYFPKRFTFINNYFS